MIPTWNHIVISFILGAFCALFTIGRKTGQEIINHTLKNPKTGQWSRKNIAGSLSMGYSIYYVQDCIIRGVTIQEFVIASFLTFSAACLGLSSWEKANVKTEGQ